MESMSLTQPSLLLAFVLLFGGGVISAAPTAKAADSAPQEAQMYPRPAYFQFGGSCSTEVSPDQAVIVGGVSSAGLKPTEAVEQLDKQLDLMRKYIAEKHGELELMERVRTVKNPPQNREASDTGFEVVQRLQAKFPANAPVDEILQKMIELGFDRYGDNVLNSFNRREAVIRFRVSGFDAKMKDFQQQCTANAWKQWCSSPQASTECKSQTAPADLQLDLFSVHSKEAFVRPDGGNAPWQLTATRSQHMNDPADLLGEMTVHLEGTISLSYHREEAKP